MEAKTKNTVLWNAVHPGSVLLLELRERGLSQKMFAKMIDMQPSHLNEIIKGNRSVTAAIADKLEKSLGIASISWLNLQTQYDRDKFNRNSKS